MFSPDSFSSFKINLIILVLTFGMHETICRGVKLGKKAVGNWACVHLNGLQRSFT
jgi:hypothetical protein